MFNELRLALRSLGRAKGLAFTIVFTLALGIGANAAIFSVIRGVLLRPLNNRDEGSLIYIRQSAPGLGSTNTTFSVPEIEDLRASVKSFNSIGEFSTLNFTLVGLGDPRQVNAGVVDGNYFEVMGLRPVLGRLLTPADDGPNAAGAVVLSNSFWTTTLNSDPSVIGKSIRLGARSATVVGVLQATDPYPSAIDLIANVVTSPHHLSATMVTGREHRMTEIFARLAPGVSLDSARVELKGVHDAMVKAHPEAYSSKAGFDVSAVTLREQVTSDARTILFILFGASALVFLIACSNVANLILARTVRREPELAVRAALGANSVALRRTLLSESLLLCGSGALLGMIVAPVISSVLGRYAARFSVRAVNLPFDPSALWIGVALALAAAVLLGFVPRLPSPESSNGLSLTSSSLRITGGTRRKLRVFAMVQIAASFVLLAGAAMLLKTLLALQAAQPGFDTASVLAINVPPIPHGSPDQTVAFYRQLQDKVAALPGVERTGLGNVVPWRDATGAGGGLAFSVEGKANANPQDDPHARFRTASPGYFTTLGIPILQGRDFNDADRKDSEKVVIISAGIAKKLFRGQDPINRQLTWTDGVAKFIGIATAPRRIVGVVPDIDDQQIAPSPALVVYHPFDQEGGTRLFVRVRTTPYSMVPAINKIAHDLAPDQPIERAATLEDVRFERLTPERLNTLVFGGFAGVALAISIVGVSGVLAFSVSARIREFGIRLAIGSAPRTLLTGVLREGLTMALIGVVLGTAGGFALAQVARAFTANLELPGVVPAAAAAVILVSAACVASLLPALRAAKVDVVEALRSE